MRFVQHVQKLPITNYDDYLIQKEKRHGDLFPNSVRACICGSSGSGKTNVLLGLLTHKNGLRFNNIYIYSKSIQQPKYQYLFDILEPIKEVGLHVFNDRDEILKPNEADKNTIFIFDDIACTTQNEIRDYYCMGRHNNIDCFYLCQTYSKIPKQLIRDNVNFLIVFRQDLTNLKHIYSDHVNTDMPLETFLNMCSVCWKTRYGFLVIDKDSELENGRYRKGFDCFIMP